MKLLEDQILELVKKPKNSNLVEKGRKYESRLRLFTEAMFEDDVADEYSWKQFRGFMEKAISREKELRLNEFVRFPLSSINITESLMSDLYKVFDAGNSYFNVDTIKKNGGEKIQEVLKELKINNWIEEKGKDALKSKPNMVVLVDKDEEGKPYIIEIDNDRLIDIAIKEDGVSCDYITFTHSVIDNEETGKKEIRYAVYDDENYFVVLNIDGDYTLEKKIGHQVGYCPARMFLKEKLNCKSEFSRKSPLTTALSKLEEWQLFDVYKFYTDHYAPFPVIEMVRAKCGRENCKNGYLYEDEVYFIGEESRSRQKSTKCDTCSGNNMVGIGSKILLDPQEDKDEPTAAGKFRMISNDVNNLEYLQNKLDKIEDYIKAKVVGMDDVVTKEAVNEKQMDGAFESKTNVLLKIKTNLDELYTWIVRTLGATTVPGKPLNVQANFGTEWYLVSEDEIQSRLKMAIDNGFPKEEVDMIYNQLIETKYKGNPEKVHRLKIINMVNPCPYYNLNDKLEHLASGIVSKQELIISERLLTFVRRFEVENGSIMDFGGDLDFRVKVQKISEQLNKYADEQSKNQPEPIEGSEGSNG